MFKHILLPTFLFLLLAAKPEPAQPWTKVKTDKNLNDPFFKTRHYGYEWFMIRNDDGSWQSAMGDSLGNDIIDTTQHEITARCIVNADTFSVMDRAEAWISHDSLHIRIEGMTASFFAKFNIDVFKNKFTSAYSTAFIFPTKNASWQTLQQELVLDKKSYQPGEELRGHIRFACDESVIREGMIGDHPGIVFDKDTVKVEGVFRCKIRGGK